MEWSSIRAFYLHCMRVRHLTQDQIVARGGISSQSVMSRMINNRRQGPKVEMFVRAVQGLGMGLSEFFAELEAFTQTSDPHEVADAASQSPFARLTRDEILAQFAKILDNIDQFAHGDRSVRANPPDADPRRPARSGRDAGGSNPADASPRDGQHGLDAPDPSVDSRPRRRASSG